MEPPKDREPIADDILSEAYAQALDVQDDLARFRERFYIPADRIYLDGNSLGLLSRDAESATLDALDAWKRLGVEGWLHADPPWFKVGELLGEQLAPLVGAQSEEVVATGSTTVNLHALVSTFYRPADRRRKIIATSLDFPSDTYALTSQITLRGGQPEQDLVLVPSADGRVIEEDDIISAMDDDTALVVLPSVLYRSGQLLDMERLARVARERSVTIGFDCAHSIGVMPHRFDAWGIDFAFWCSYKYLNAGPGSVGGLFVNRRHFGAEPGLTGWWGYQKDRQFDMSQTWEGAATAGAWQISTPPVLATAPLLGSLRLFEQVDIEAIREKSVDQTSYLMDLIEARGLTTPRFGFRIGSPREARRRGGHVAIEHNDAPRIVRALKARGVIPDFRPPDTIRLAPIPLYTSFHELWQVAEMLKEIVATGAFRREQAGRDLVA